MEYQPSTQFDGKMLLISQILDLAGTFFVSYMVCKQYFLLKVMRPRRIKLQNEIIQREHQERFNSQVSPTINYQPNYQPNYNQPYYQQQENAVWVIPPTNTTRNVQEFGIIIVINKMSIITIFGHIFFCKNFINDLFQYIETGASLTTM